MALANPRKRAFLCLTAEPGSVCAGLPKKPRAAPPPPPPPCPPPKSQLLSLPAELRNEIYSHALVRRSPIQLPYAYQTRSCTRSSSTSSSSTTTAYSAEPPLLSVCRALRAEALPIYYGCNIFEAPSPAAAYKFLFPLAAAKVRALRMFRPVELVLPLGAAQKRWRDAVKRCVNRLVKDCGKGVLGVEAVSVPVRSRHGGVEWVGLREAGFTVRIDGREGRWSLDEAGIEGEDVEMGW